ncbi:MAG TPA: hypothetical protein VFK06_08275 [Candidatus Angelobacter sp.]|nr:hypothetical protein [Candidatus Angelobacter sp.]
MDPEGSEGRVTSHQLPFDLLEQRAAEQRQHLHDNVVELRHAVREKLTVKRTLNSFLWPAAGVMALAGLTAGFIVTGLFTRE